MLTKLYVRGRLLLDDLKNDQRGVTAIEYALIAGAITLAVAAALTGTNIKTELASIFDNLETAVSTAAK